MKVKVILAYSGSAISDDRRHIFQILKEHLMTHPPEFVRCYAYGLNTLHEINVNSSSNPPINSELELINFGHTQSPYKSFYGQINAEKLVELWNQHKHFLVEKKYT